MTESRPAEAPSLFDELRYDGQDPGGAGRKEGDITPAADSPAQPSFAYAEADPGRAPERLPPEGRRALVELLRRGVVMADSRRRVFEVLCRHQAAIEARLADLYLRLLLDRQGGLALLLRDDDGQESGDEEEDEEGAGLIPRRTLSLYDTLLLLVLRKYYQERETAGEQRIIVDLERLETLLNPFLPLSNSSRSDRRRLSGTLEKFKDSRVLAAVRGEEERFEITPVIRHVVNAQFLERMLADYRRLAAGAAGRQPDQPTEGAS
ncbi:MAG: DUF4194 domain-containing protein [Candidatus Competibacteraceae bacterium]|nr:DUF4194 domain-containing protein [Candidatus Competibacteraceae bacterium]